MGFGSAQPKPLTDAQMGLTPKAQEPKQEFHYGQQDEGPPALVAGRQRILMLSQAAKERFGGRQEIPSGTPRNIQGTNTPSLHNLRLATDLFPQDSKQLPAAAKWATEQPGVQVVIFNRQVWTPGKGWHPYSKDGDPHLDHVHVDYGRPSSKAKGKPVAASSGFFGDPGGYVRGMLRSKNKTGTGRAGVSGYLADDPNAPIPNTQAREGTRGGAMAYLDQKYGADPRYQRVRAKIEQDIQTLAYQSPHRVGDQLGVISQAEGERMAQQQVVHPKTGEAPMYHPISGAIIAGADSRETKPRGFTQDVADMAASKRGFGASYKPPAVNKQAAFEDAQAKQRDEGKEAFESFGLSHVPIVGRIAGLLNPAAQTSFFTSLAFQPAEVAEGLVNSINHIWGKDLDGKPVSAGDRANGLFDLAILSLGATHGAGKFGELRSELAGVIEKARTGKALSVADQQVVSKAIDAGVPVEAMGVALEPSAPAGKSKGKPIRKVGTQPIPYNPFAETKNPRAPTTKPYNPFDAAPETETMGAVAVPEEPASGPVPTTVASPPSGEVSLQSGIDIPGAIKAADDMSIPPNDEGGFFDATRPDGVKKPDPRSLVRSPLSIVDGEGKTIQVGEFERVMGEQGKEISQIIRGAERSGTARTKGWTDSLNEVRAYLTDVAKNSKNGLQRTKTRLRQVEKDFLSLVERDFDDPSRVDWKNSNTATGKALNIYDAMTEDMRQYAIESRHALGIDTPADWGITEQGYYRHMFLGDLQVFVDGEFVGAARTYVEAQKIASDILQGNKNTKHSAAENALSMLDKRGSSPGAAQIHLEARDNFPSDPTVRVSTGKYFKLGKKLSDRVSVPMAEIMEDLRGTVGRNAGKQKFFGALMQRHGAAGYSTQFLDVMQTHAAQLARTQELSKLNREIQPKLEALRKQGLGGWAEMVQDHVDALWGVPSKDEVLIGGMIENTKVLRNYVANPTMALRSLARRTTAVHSALKLKYNIKSTLVNSLQSSTTLAPFTTVKEYAAIIADYMKPSTRKMLLDKGVFEGGTKLSEGVAVKSKSKRGSIFERASSMNRGLGYLYGYRDAIARGLSESVAHDSGLAWAEKVEFDNSVWNAPPILRSPTGRVLGQFKGFTIKQFETLGDMNRARPGESPGIRAGKPNLKAVKRLGKFAVAQGLMGGVRSVPLAAKVFGGYKIAQFLSTQLQSQGMSREDADKYADAAYYGAPSLLGQDLSGSLAVLDQPYGNSTWEQIGNFAGGPTGSLLVKLKEFISDGDWMKAARAASPYVKQGESLYTVGTGGKVMMKTPGGKEVEAPALVGAMMGLGFTPVQQTKAFDEQEAGGSRLQQLKKRDAAFKAGDKSQKLSDDEARELARLKADSADAKPKTTKVKRQPTQADRILQGEGRTVSGSKSKRKAGLRR